MFLCFPYHIHLQTWQLLSNNGEPFSLSFDTFNVYYDWDDDNDGFPDCRWDYVYISGGTSSSPQPINKKHCNHYFDATGPIPGPFTGIDMIVKFGSNAYTTRTGFFAVITGDVSVTTDVIGKS